MAVIPNVVTDEFIESSWGNAVADELNLRTVKSDGSRAMTGPLTLPAGNPTAVQAARRDYVDAADNLRAPLTGAVFSGSTYVTRLPTATDPGIGMQTNGRLISGVDADSIPNAQLTRIGSPGAGTGQPFVRFSRGADLVGSITVASATSVAYNTTSDGRLKQVDRPLDPSDGLGQALALEPVLFRWLGDVDELGDDAPLQVGFISQAVAGVVPQAVTGAPDGVDPDGGIIPQQLDPSALIPVLVAAVQALAARVAALEAQP